MANAARSRARYTVARRRQERMQCGCRREASGGTRGAADAVWRAQITKLYFQLFKVFFCTFFSILINIVVRVAA